MDVIFKALVGAFSVIVFSITLQAGDKLHFKAGSFSTMNDSALSLMTAEVSNPEATKHFVVQFKGPITIKDRESLKASGLLATDYIPDDALLVHGDFSDVKRFVEGSESVHTYLPFQPGWKISPSVGPLSVFDRGRSIHLVIELMTDKNLNQVLEEMESWGSHIQFASEDLIYAFVDKGQVYSLAKIDAVQWIQPVPEFSYFHLPLDNDLADVEAMAGDYTDLTGYESGTKVIKADKAWARGFKGAGEVVAVGDTGLDTGKKSTLNKDFGLFKKGYALGFFSKTWADPNGHGTHVSGSVVGNGKTSKGNIKGAGPEAGLMMAGMWSTMFDNLTVPQKLEDLFKGPYKDGARIHTNSWGSPMNLGVYDKFSSEVDKFMWENPDMLILFAAGNSGEDKDRDGRIDEGSVSSPGTAKNCLTVGASENLVSKGGIQAKLGDLRVGKQKWGVEPLKSDKLSDDINGIAAFSSRGPTKDKRLKPELVAPGTNVLSVKSKHKDAGELWGKYNSDYVWSGGTSMATPLAAGSAAVVRGYLRGELNISKPSAAVVKAVMIHTATDMFPGQYGKVGKAKGQEILGARPDMNQGFGRIDLDYATDLDQVEVFDESQGLSQGDFKEVEVDIADGENLIATLAYTDAPAAANASSTLVNDLDLEVVAPDGTVHSLSDHTNNVELLQLENLTSGTYRVLVRATRVSVPRAGGALPFALVISN